MIFFKKNRPVQKAEKENELKIPENEVKNEKLGPPESETRDWSNSVEFYRGIELNRNLNLKDWLFAFEIQNYRNFFKSMTNITYSERHGSFGSRCKLVVHLTDEPPEEIISAWCVSEFDAFAFAFKKYIHFIKNHTKSSELSDNSILDDSNVPSVSKIEEKELKIEKLLENCNTELDYVYNWFKKLKNSQSKDKITFNREFNENVWEVEVYFDKIAVNGVKFDTDYEFKIYEPDWKKARAILSLYLYKILNGMSENEQN